MSGLAAVYQTSGAPVEREELGSLLASICHRGQREMTWHRRGVALGQRLLPTTREALEERLPIEVAGGCYQVALDGRLDNRGDLLNALGIEARSPVLTDPDLIALAYEKWNANAVKHFIGDFAFMLWDDVEGLLYAARDQRGFKPLVYSEVAGGMLFGSEPQQLLSSCRIRSRAIDRLYLASHLTGALLPSHRTHHEAIQQLPPGHFLTLDRRGLRLQEYWTYSPRRRVEYAHYDEYVDEFKDIFREAARAAVRTIDPPGILLSGGLDSSYVAACAVPFAPKLQGFIGFTPDGGSMDERPYSRAIAGHLGIQLTEYDIADCWSLSSESISDADFDQPQVPVQAAAVFRAFEVAKKSGATTVLDGIGGDEFLSGQYDYMADLLARGHVSQALTEAIGYGRRIEAVQRVLKTGLLAPMVPSAIRHPWKSLRSRTGPANVPAWIDQEQIRASGLSEALNIPHEPLIWNQEARHRVLWAAMQSEILPHLAWWERRAAAPNQIESRSPFWDLRILEFIMRTPQWVHRHNGRMKMLLRSAMRGHVPDLIVDRDDKGVFTKLFLRGILEQESSRVDAAFQALSGQDFIKPHALHSELERYRSRPHKWWSPMWRAVTAGLWLRRSGGVPRSALIAN